MRVLTRILPFLYEADHLEVWEDKFFWAKRKKKSKSQAAKPEVPGGAISIFLGSAFLDIKRVGAKELL